MNIYEHLTIKFSNLRNVQTVLKSLKITKLILFGPRKVYYG